VLHEGTHSLELCFTPIPRRWALVQLLLVRGAVQVRIQSFQGPAYLGAENTLVPIPIPRILVCKALRDHPVWSSDQPCRVGDDTVTVKGYDETIELVAGDARRTGARFTVADESGVGDEFDTASGSRAGELAGLVCAGAEMVVEIALGVEDAVAKLADPLVANIVSLAIMFLEPSCEVEDLSARFAVVVLILVMSFELVFIVKKHMASLTIKVVRALDEVLNEPLSGGKVSAALVTNVVAVGVVFMLREGSLGIERAIASVAPIHFYELE